MEGAHNSCAPFLVRGAYPRRMDISRLYTGEDGKTHIERMNLETHPELGTLQRAEGIQFRSTPAGHFMDWHPAPRR